MRLYTGVLLMYIVTLRTNMYVIWLATRARGRQLSVMHSDVGLVIMETVTFDPNIAGSNASWLQGWCSMPHSDHGLHLLQCCSQHRSVSQSVCTPGKGLVVCQWTIQ